MMNIIKSRKKGFTLIELLVVIAIIGILATLAVVALQNARKNARDAKRMADVKQIQTALELYYNDIGSYPLTGEIDESIATGSNTYMAIIPTAPTPADGDCSDEENEYTYTSSDGITYTIEFCTGSGVGGLNEGLKLASPSGIVATTPPVPWACGDNLTDSRDSNVYTTVEIDTQCWMAENLAYLPSVHSNSQFYTQGGSSLPGYGVYGYDGSDVPTAKAQDNYTTYGVLYNFFAVDQVNICPTDWHVPTDAEWTILTTYLGGTTVAGGKMKQTGTTLWTSPNTGATNESGFTALPAGYRNTVGSFSDVANDVYFWSSSVNNPNAWYRGLSYNSVGVYVSSGSQAYGFPVRCLQD
ncbi:MAG: FISUMP domain-containing protein [Patescibacteria group bacterium]|nr:FISUMP domain-containing protein [Patescibacteria group bacterium]